MALTPAIFTIVPNLSDGVQRLSDPDGLLAPPVDVLDPVDTLTVTTVSSTELRVDWSYSGTGHTGFELQRFSAGGTWVTIATPASSIRQYTDSGLSASTLYRYRIRAVDGGDPDRASNWTNAEGTTANAPGNGTETDLSNLLYFENFQGGTGRVSTHTAISAETASNTRIGEHAPGAGDRSFETYKAPSTSGGGFGAWGGIIENRSAFPRVQYDSEIWWRMWAKMPSGWNNDASPRMKFMRFNKMKTNGESAAYLDVYLDGRRPAVIAEGPSEGKSDWYNAPVNITLGQWFCMEFYVNLHNKAFNNGGKGRMILWLNGTRVVDAKDTGLINPTERVSRVLWCTYYNGEPSRPVQGFTHWSDQWAIAVRGTTEQGARDDTVRMARDADGFPFIGLAVK